MKRSKTRPCLECHTKKARLPEENKTFCSLKCGFEWAVQFSSEYLECGSTWCEKHAVWYMTTQDCEHCGDEEKERESKGKGQRSCYTHGDQYRETDGCPTCNAKGNAKGKETVAAYEGRRL